MRVRSTDAGGTGEHARIADEMADKGWHLMAATTCGTGVFKPRVCL